jgi:hypothetical protein
MEIVQLTHCPYCEGPHGDIFIDGCELSIMWEERADCGPEEAHERFVRHNSRHPESGPCQHLVYFVVNICSFSGATRHVAREYWEPCAAWLNPRVRELDPKDVLREVRAGFVFIDELGDLGPDEPYELDSFGHAWCGFTKDGQTEISFEAEGYAVFAADIDAFVADLIKKNNLHHAGCTE